MKPYYRIYRAAINGPKFATLEEAQQAAQRAAAANPGEAYEILHCHAITQTQTPATFWLDGVVPPHPAHP